MILASQSALYDVEIGDIGEEVGSIGTIWVATLLRQARGYIC